MQLYRLFDRWKTRGLYRQINWKHGVPRHIAIMMDGNGRWGTQRRLPRSAGHYAGMQAMRDTIFHCQQIGLPVLTLYAFSTENWKRPEAEVNAILQLVHAFVKDDTIDALNRHRIRIQFIGDLRPFPADTQAVMARAAAATAQNDSMVVQIAMNYGGRHEILHAVQAYLADPNKQELSEDSLEQYLYTAGVPSPELVIRTSGEKRLSGFLLWQTARAEIWFTNIMWPSFRKRHLYEAIADYQRRKQRQLLD